MTVSLTGLGVDVKLFWKLTYCLCKSFKKNPSKSPAALTIVNVAAGYSVSPESIQKLLFL